MSYVFLILVFSTGTNTVNVTTPMPSMDVCEQMLDYHMDDLPSSGSWLDPTINKPKVGFCKEIKPTTKPE